MSATATAGAAPTVTAPPPDAEIRITAEPTTDATTMRFVVDRTVLDGAARFGGKAEAAGSPLAEAIFDIPVITRVQLLGNVVTVTKTGDDEWLPVARQIGAGIRAHIKSGRPAVSADVIAKQAGADAATRKRIAEVFEQMVNPAIAAHGGHCELVDYRNNVVYVRMSGGCQGCSSSTATLKYGIERMVREAVPDIVDVIDVTDHAAGHNPYFR